MFKDIFMKDLFKDFLADILLKVISGGLGILIQILVDLMIIVLPLKWNLLNMY